MANKEQLSILKQGVEVWNKWRYDNPDVEIDLRKADLHGANLAGTDLFQADLEWADLKEALLMKANLMSANLMNASLCDARLNDARLVHANLTQADVRGAMFMQADLGWANFTQANLTKALLPLTNCTFTDFEAADLHEANLVGARLLSTNIHKANISGARVYGASVWDLQGEFEQQKDLIITRDDPMITVDNINVAQFIYLILNNEQIRDAINTLTSKSVLILGRFTLFERKMILDALRNKLREYDLLPIVFDFDRPTDKDFTETIKTLAGLSYFVIADVTNPKSSPLELQATVPDYQIPFVPIIQEGESPFAMMVDLQKKYNWVLNTVSYDSEATLMKALKPLIIDPAMKKRQELRIIKAHEPEIISAKDFLKKGTA
jgi:hypothetical protein